jgi:hypothetical protein
MEPMRSALVVSWLVVASCKSENRATHDVAPSISLAAGSVSALATASPEASTPKPTCPTSPRADALKRLHAFCKSTSDCVTGDDDGALGKGEAIGDLDGDGIDETAFYFGSPMVMAMHVYKCDKHLADIAGTGKLVAAKTVHDGFADIELEDYAACDGAPCGCVPGSALFVYRSGKYIEETSKRKASVRNPCGD